MSDDVLQLNNLPNNIEMEKYLIGCMLVQDGKFIPRILYKLYIDDYFQERNRVVVSAIFDLYINLKQPVNTYSVAMYLRQNNLTDKVPPLYVVGLPELVTTTGYIDEAVKLVKGCANRRRIIRAASNLAKGALDGNTPPAKLYTTIHDEFAGVLRQSPNGGLTDVFSYISKGLRKDLADIARFSNRQTGFDNLDANMEDKFAPGLYILGATPAIGKTTFAWQLLEQCASQGQKCVYISYEMERERLVTKTLSRRAFLLSDKDPATPTAHSIRNGVWSDEVQQAAIQSADFAHNFHFLKFSLENVDDLINDMYVAASQWEAPIFCIDYLQNIPPLKEFAGNTKLSVDDCVRKLKNFQTDTRSVVLAISSINRLSYMQQINMDAMKESGIIEYAADVIWGLQMNVVNRFKGNTSSIDARNAFDEALREHPREIHLKCLKNREGRLFDCYFNYYSAHDYFEPNDALEPFIPGSYEVRRPADTIEM